MTKYIALYTGLLILIKDENEEKKTYLTNVCVTFADGVFAGSGACSAILNVSAILCCRRSTSQDDLRAKNDWRKMLSSFILIFVNLYQ